MEKYMEVNQFDFLALFNLSKHIATYFNKKPTPFNFD